MSRAVGWVRLIVITALFGASRELDAYFAAFRIPDAIFQLVAGGVLGSVLVPAIAQRSHAGTGSAWRLVSGVANVLLVLLAILSTAGAIAAPLLVPIIAPGFDAEQQALAVDLTRLMLVSPVCFSLGAVAASVLHSEHRFAAGAVAPIFYNVAIIGAALALSAQLGVMALAVGVAAGAMLYLVVQVVPLLARTSYRYHATGLNEPGVRPAMLALAPRSFGLAATQLIFIVNTALASTLGVGAVTAYSIAFALLLIPVGLVGVPLGTVLFPSLAQAAAAGSHAEFRRVMLGATRFTLWAAAGLTVVAVVVHRPLVELLFGGALGPATIDAVASTAVVLFAGIGAHSVNLVTARAFYAWNDTRTPVILTLVQVVLTITIGIVAAGYIGLPGLALAVAVGSWFKAAALIVLLGRRDLLDVGGIASALIPVALATAAAGACAGLMVIGIDVLLGDDTAAVLRNGAVIAGATLGGGLAFLAVSHVLHLAEVGRLFELARVAVRRG